MTSVLRHATELGTHGPGRLLGRLLWLTSLLGTDGLTDGVGGTSNGVSDSLGVPAYCAVTGSGYIFAFLRIIFDFVVLTAWCGNHDLPELVSGTGCLDSDPTFAFSNLLGIGAINFHAGIDQISIGDFYFLFDFFLFLGFCACHSNLLL